MKYRNILYTLLFVFGSLSVQARPAALYPGSNVSYTVQKKHHPVVDKALELMAEDLKSGAKPVKTDLLIYQLDLASNKDMKALGSLQAPVMDIIAKKDAFWIGTRGSKTVIVGSRDPNELVNGGGVRQLEEAGITVIQDFLREECDIINPIFFHYIKTKMPYVIVKYAMTADGKTSLSTGESRWITGDAARENVHRTRGTTSAIMCGIKTVLADDPMLNCRVEGPLYKQPVRVVLDRNLELPLESNLVKTAGEIPVIVFTGKNSMASVSEAGKNILSGLGIEIIPVSEIVGHLNLHEVLSVLGEKKIDSVFVESGGTLNASLFFAGGRCLVNELHCYVAPKITGGINGSVHSPVQGLECSSLDDCVKMKMIEVKNFGEDILIRYMICK